MKISFGILAHDETDSLEKLLDALVVKRPYEYEIVVIHDKTGNVDKTEDILTTYWRSDCIQIYERPLNGDFAAQKNFMTEKCEGDYIVNPDADELFPDYLLENVHLIIEQNDTELIWVPRINIVEGLTSEWAMKFHFQVNEKGWVNYPDPQQRIYRNDYPRIHWENKVHERITGFKTYSVLPHDLDMAEHLSIKHVKSLDRQIKQNQKYAEIMNK